MGNNWKICGTHAKIKLMADRPNREPDETTES